MKIYLVGGAVRDALLNWPVQERDWVVVGATVEEMLAQGFRPVGKDFPVFLHPETHEEYALARTERKTGRGYQGFSFNTDPTVTLEEDLKRRDLTINAIAQDETGKIIDPYHGQRDLKNKQLRHVSDAFSEDPVRILRAARFAARFHHLGFQIADETCDLMKTMVKNGEVDHLVPERVWKECTRALTELSPSVFFKTLFVCGAARILFPFLHQKNIDALSCIKESNPVARFAVLMYHLSIESIQAFCNKYRISREYHEQALLVARHLADYRSLDSAESILRLLEITDAFRKKERFAEFLFICSSITNDLSKATQLETALRLLQSLDIQDIVHASIDGKSIAAAIRKRRLKALAITFNNY